MILIIQLILAALLFILISRRLKKVVFSNNKSNLFRRFNQRTLLHKRFLSKFHDRLMSDPDQNIKINHWDSETESREKADMHRQRLNKYGRSRINGEILFLGPRGGVYRFTPQGRKVYL